uniref:Uncharacterized protein n=1 Tax=Seriola dumerili TaxID=41447 RepID=A0A3B4VLI9_SERDU
CSFLIHFMKSLQPSEGSRTHACLHKSAASNLRSAAPEHSAITHAHSLCLPRLNHMQMTPGCYKVTAAPLHTSDGSIITQHSAVYAGDIRLPELINPTHHNLRSNLQKRKKKR